MTRVIQASEWHATLVGQSLNHMRESGVLCDIIIQSCDGQEFLAHGCVLAAASPILKAAINNTFGQLSTLRMDWLSGAVLETLLNFIYTGELKVYSGDTEMVSDFFYAVGQLEMTGVLVSCPDGGLTDDVKKCASGMQAGTHCDAGASDKATSTTAERHITSNVTKHTSASAIKAELASANKTEISSASKTEVSSTNKPEVYSAKKTEIYSANKAGVASTSKLPPESTKSGECGADHSYADANSETCADLSVSEMSSRLCHSSKSRRKTRMWGCPSPMMVHRKSFLPRAFSLKCPICRISFSDSMKLANHRLHDAPVRVFRAWQDGLDQSQDITELETDPPEDEADHSTTSETDAVKTEFKVEATPASKDGFLCTECGKEFEKKSQLKTHSKTHVMPLTCPVCARPCKSRSKLRRHQLTHTKEKPYFCKECGKSFQLNESLVIHSRLHTGERPFKCCICNQGFRDKSVMRNHELKHTGAKPFQCAQCGRQYGSRNALSRHRNVHTLERCYRCEHCARVFYQLSGLMCHRRTHTGEKPYMCSICARAFGDRSSMRRHERVHTGERPYACPTCNKTFTQSSSLKSHQKTHIKPDCAKIICVEMHPTQGVSQLP
ncbi:hypothetical protein LSAT2_020863 [Lamellibrachia satsuma]|nr:hypothetical protein LSAT2_020863 [Lamellibrachia satsuma]